MPPGVNVQHDCKNPPGGVEVNHLKLHHKNNMIKYYLVFSKNCETKMKISVEEAPSFTGEACCIKQVIPMTG